MQKYINYNDLYFLCIPTMKKGHINIPHGTSLKTSPMTKPTPATSNPMPKKKKRRRRRREPLAT